MPRGYKKGHASRHASTSATKTIIPRADGADLVAEEAIVMGLNVQEP
jgi:hypothetical protein